MKPKSNWCALIFGASTSLSGHSLPARQVPVQDRVGGVAGYVLSLHGTWLVGPRPEVVTSGRALTAADTVRAGAAPWNGNDIVLVMRSGAAVRYRCADHPGAAPTPEAWDCARPIVLAAATRLPLYARILDAIMNQFGKHPGQPASLLSRGSGDPDLREAVATLRGNALDLGGALSAVPAGNYRLTLRPLRVEDTAAIPTGTVTTVRLAWNPAAPVKLRTAGLGPGVYQLGVEDASAVAWILICAGAECDAARGTFRKARDIAARWNGHLNPSDTRTFLRAALELLSEPGTPQ